MKRKTALFSSVLSSGMALALLAPAQDSHAFFYIPGFDFHKNRSCYPDNEWTLAQNTDAGPLWAFTNGYGNLTDGEIEIPPDTDGIEPVAGKIRWTFNGNVKGNYGNDLTQTDGSMSGYFEVTVYWEDPDLPQTTFRSDCIAELQLDEGKIEAELEGWVSGFPYERTKRYAVASFNAQPSEDNTRGVKFQVAIEFGRTCFEELVVPEDSFNEFEINVTSDQDYNGSVKLSRTEPESEEEFGRAALPYGYPRADFPDQNGDINTWKIDRHACPGVWF